MTTTMTTVDNILKEVYEKQLKDQLQSDIVTIKRVEATSEGVSSDVGGKYVRFPVRVKRNHGIGARGEYEPLPAAKRQGYKSAQVNLAYLYGTVELTGQTFELAETNTQAFASALDQEVNGMREGLAKDVNRQVYGTSEGKLAISSGAGTITTFETSNTQYLEAGMVVDIYDAGDTIQDSDVEIDSISGTTVTFSSNVTAPGADDYLVRSGSRSNEKVGFSQILDIEALEDTTGGFTTLFNITDNVWTPNQTNLAGPLSEAVMIQMVDDIGKRGGKTTVIFTSHGVRRAYFNLLVAQRKYTATESRDFGGGFTGLTFTTDKGDIPLVNDYDCQPGRMYFMNEMELKLYQAGDWSFMNRDGSNWQRVIKTDGTYDAYEAIFYKYCQLGTHRRNSHGIIYGVTEA